MWLDNASDIDMLFYQPYAQLTADIVKKKEYNPLTIGLFGLWGAGKSTLLELIFKSIDPANNNIACAQLNAWMFEGYEDAKAALMEALLNEMKNNISKFGNVVEGITNLLRRVDYFKLGTTVLSKGAPLLASILTGNPLPLTLSIAGDANKIEELIKGASDSIHKFKDSYVKDPEASTVENIRKFKSDFEKILDDSKIDNLVVMVDDLDRCTPDRIIDTLEAIKLFLSVKRTTFIIAADETVIQYAIRKKYPPIDGSLVEISSEYIEKIIQLPIYIPDLSSKDIENYLLLLVAQLYMHRDKFKLLLQNIFDDKLILKEESLTLEDLRKRIDTLSEPFKDHESKIEFNKDIEIINSIKNIVSSTLKGNPRQAKRFLNTFITKKALSQMYFGDELNMQILAKLLVLQKLNSSLFKQLNDWDKDFKMNNEKLKLVYDCVNSDPRSIPEEYTQWATPRITRWFDCEPKNLYEIKLDKYFYLSREELKNNNDNMNRLSEKTKDILQKIGKSSEATIDPIMEQLKISGPQIIEEVIEALLPNIKKGEVEFFIIKKVFSACPSYRDVILIQVKNMPKSKLAPYCIPYLKSMLSEAPDKVKPILEEMIDKNLPKKIYDSIIEKIVDVSTKAKIKGEQ